MRDLYAEWGLKEERASALLFRESGGFWVAATEMCVPSGEDGEVEAGICHKWPEEWEWVVLVKDKDNWTSRSDAPKCTLY